MIDIVLITLLLLILIVLIYRTRKENQKVEYERIRKEKFEEAGLTYIQTGTDKIALEKAKQEIQIQDQQGN